LIQKPEGLRLHRQPVQRVPCIHAPLRFYSWDASFLSALISLDTLSVVILPSILLFTMTTGAMLQEPTHATCSRVNCLSSVVFSSSVSFNSLFRLVMMRSEPLTWQAVPRQAVIMFLPLGLRQNWA